MIHFIPEKQRYAHAKTYLLDLDGIGDNFDNAALGHLVHQLGIQEAGEVTMQPLVAGDELVREAQAGHEAALLESEDGAERSGEEDALERRYSR